MFGFFESKRDSVPGHYRKIKGEGTMPNGNWMRVSQLLTTNGVQFRRDEVIRFSNLAFSAHRERKKFGIVLEKEPSNEADHNAIKVIGWAASSEFHVGYVERFEAARLATRFPNEAFAAEFYSLYHSSNDYIDIRFFTCVPAHAKPSPSANIRRLFERIEDELVLLTALASSDGKRGRIETDILNKFVLARSEDLALPMTEEDASDIRRWLRDQNPTLEDLAMAVDRISDKGELTIDDLWELAEIVVSADGKIAKGEREALEVLSEQIKLSFGT